MTAGRGGEIRRGIFWIAVAAAVFLVVDVVYVAFAVQSERMVFLEEQNRLLHEVLNLQVEHCQKVERVNQVCEGAMAMLVERLGLDVDKLPVFTTGIVARGKAVLGGQGGP